MKSTFLRNTIIIFLMFLIFPASCSIKTEEQKKFGVDAEYFVALQLLNNNDEKAAITKLEKCAKKGTFYCALESKRLLCTLGTYQQKEKACKNLLKENPDEKSLEIILNHYENINDFQKIFEITKNLEINQKNNNLIKFRLETLQKSEQNEHSKLLEEAYIWFTELPISIEHYHFYRDTLSTIIDFSEQNIENLSAKEFSIFYRMQIYKRDYIFAFNYAQKLFDYFENQKLQPCAQLSSDIGKAFLYGNGEVLQNAMFFSEMAKKYENTPMEFYFWFYSGRLFDKASLYATKTKDSFENAIKCAETDLLKDNAIWYLLNTSLSSSINSMWDLLKKYAPQWTDPSYFDDFFDALSAAIFTAGDWNLFNEVYKTINEYASPAIVSQFAYLSGRLIQTGHIQSSEEEMINAFENALTCGNSIYYQNLAKYQLIKNKVDVKPLESKIKKIKNTDSINYDAGILLEGYATFGFPEKIYPTWSSLENKNIPQDKLLFLCEFLQSCSTGEDDYFTQSLIMAVKLENHSILKYPKNYSELIEKFSNQYKIDSTIIYSLIRGESFFDPDVTSVAGAIGLCQLMEFTGSDIARKLKLSDYSLTDPETNIHFGTYYLTNLISRLENNYLHGFFAYNAGITRVRRWLNTSILGFGKKSTMPADLFLETLPYTETREYGRKLVSASIMYKTLYSKNPDKDFKEIIELLLKF